MTDNEEGMIEAGDVNVKKINITSHEGTQFDVLRLFDRIVIYEDIYSNTLTGSIDISDSLSFLESSQISGGEKIDIEFSTAGYTNTANLQFRIYKISTRTKPVDRNNVYSLYFCSSELLVNSMMKISKSFSDTANNIIDEIITSDYGLRSNKIVDSSDSFGGLQFISCYWSPFKAINWVARRAINPLTLSAGYLFFENKKGFVFKSLDELLAQDVVAEYISEPTSESRDVFDEMLVVNDYTVLDSFDMMDAIQNGAFSGALFTYDITNKTFDREDYNYHEQFENKNHLGNHPLLPIEIDIEGVNPSNALFSNLEFRTDADKTFPDFKSHYYDRWVLKRKAQISQLKMTRILLDISGDSNLNVGETINFYLPSPEIMFEDKELDDPLQGKFLITSIRHDISREKYEQKVEISKESLSAPRAGKLLNDKTKPSPIFV